MVVLPHIDGHHGYGRHAGNKLCDHDHGDVGVQHVAAACTLSHRRYTVLYTSAAGQNLRGRG
jgi:hypothetical protein